ncbi:MAG: tRNA pseudouridine(13) synthase TruD [Planctomycetaceae bacterium]
MTIGLNEFMHEPNCEFNPFPEGISPTLPFLTADVPGIGGEIKKIPEDFFVEEIPAYLPCGQGEHLFLFIEKRNVSAEQLTQHLASVLSISPRDIGMAGLKDRYAVTRQWVSVPARCQSRLSAIEAEDIHLLESSLHTNKLKTGHLKGNRFRLLIRTILPDARKHSEQIRQRILQIGFPNYFGSQRFGKNLQTLQTGMDLLRGKMNVEAIPFRRRRFLLRLSLSAAQSWLFNHSLANRISVGDATLVHVGDVMQVTQSGGLFVAENAAAEQARLEQGETAITGPLFGPKMKSPHGLPLTQETKVLEAFQLERSDFLRFKKITQGTRRPLLMRPKQFSLQQNPEGILADMELPRGVYATMLMRELMKPDLQNS